MRDDKILEEEDQTYAHLLAALRSSAQQHESISATEQAGIIARVRERLASTAAASASAAPAVSAPPTPSSFAPAIPTKHTGTSMRWGVRLLVALGVLVCLLGSSWALLIAAPFSRGIALSTIASPVPASPAPSAQTEAHGLEASMRVLIAGPYFLSELLPIDLSLTNHTQQTVTLAGISTTANLCHDSALMVKVTAGDDPAFVFPEIERACDQVFYTTQIKSGETLTIHQYVPLTKSQIVTLTMQPGAEGSPRPLDPLDGHWPSVQIQVQPQMPPNRALALQEQPGLVTIQTPAGTQPKLLSMQSISCKDYADGSGVQWTPLATNVLHQPACPGTHPRWEYIVSAPGYSIVSGSQQA